MTRKLKYLVTGGAGFIGSHLLDRLFADEGTDEIRVIDNFSSGRREHLAQFSGDSRLRLYESDLLDFEAILPVFAGCDAVVHLAANPDARWGIDNTRLDLEQETIVTYNVLECMRRQGVGRILFSSSGTVYGDIGTEPAVETRGPALPISLYGAGKVASEALISAFCGTFGLSAIILRFGNIVGERTTHGVIFDFIRQLARDSATLKVLGDGHQSKPYVYVKDLVAALHFARGLLLGFPSSTFDVYNVAPDGGTSVRTIAGTLLARLGLEGRTSVAYGVTAGGWPGDVPKSRMDSSRLASVGFHLARSSDEAVAAAIDGIVRWLGTRPSSGDGLRLPDPS